MRTVLTLFPGWSKVARTNLSNLSPHPDPANHAKFVRGDGTLAAVAEAGSFEWVAVPASDTATGTEGQASYDGDYLYVCVDTNTWRRVPLSAWS